jgi:probable F420-dependent oxidoreductase
MELSGVGVWSGQLRYGGTGEVNEAAAELEELGFTALWIPDIGGPVFEAAERLLAATRTVTVATGILNLWMHTPAEAAAGYAALSSGYGNRFLMGIGVSHAVLVDRDEPARYQRPLAATRSYLDGLDAAEPPVPASGRLLAALGPKMLAMAAVRTRGAHPYLVTPEHTKLARETLGEGPLLAPEQTVIFAADRDQARAVGHDWLHRYMTLPNYANSVLRLGFSQQDVEQVSDRLFDALIAWGDEEAVTRRVAEHRAAGADHVCLQVLTSESNALPRAEWRRIATALG